MSNRSRDVRDGLVARARAGGVGLQFGSTVTAVERRGESWRVRTTDGELAGTRVVIATGGLSVPKTGSDGFGLALARALGHVVQPTYAALTPLTASPTAHAALSGVSLDVRIEASSVRERARAAGGFLFTHRGYSGPSVLDVSHVSVRSQSAGSRARRRARGVDANGRRRLAGGTGGVAGPGEQHRRTLPPAAAR